MASQQEDLLVQKITLIRDDKPVASFDRAFLKELTYVETLDLSGPRLIFVMDDQYRIVRDDLGVREKDVLEVVLADRFQQDGLDATLRVVIITMPVADRFVTFNCIESHLNRLKTPARTGEIFSRKTVADVVKKLAPGLKYDLGSFPAPSDYHLLPGMRPSKLLRQMAMEQGAVCFLLRGTLVFKKLKDLYAAAPAIEYHHNDASKDNRILVYGKPNTTAIIADRVDRNYIGWDMVDGLVKSGKLPTAPPEFTSAAKTTVLDNLTVIPKPMVEFTTAGNGHLLPGAALGLKWHTERPDMPLDESLPAKAVVGLVAHSWRPQAYFCRVTGVTP